jgi:hypothetical protein
MQRAFFRGIRVALQRWPVVITLWLVSVVFGLGFAWAGGTWLHGALDRSLATRTLLDDLDPDVLIDLFMYHREGLYLLLVVAALLGAAYVLLWLWFHGVIVASVRAHAPATLGAAFRRGVDTVPVMAQLFVVAALVLALDTALIGGTAWALRRWTVASPSEVLRDGIVLGALGLWLGTYVVLVAIHDHARIRAGAAAEGALRAYGWAVRFVLRGGEPTLRLAVALNLSGVAVWVVYQTIGMNIPVSEGFGMTALVVWGELFLAARMFLRVWFFAAQSDLQSLA